GVGIIGPDLLDQLILSQHASNVAMVEGISQVRKKGRPGAGARTGRLLLRQGRRSAGKSVGVCESSLLAAGSAVALGKLVVREFPAVGNEALQFARPLGEVL